MHFGGRIYGKIYLAGEASPQAANSSVKSFSDACRYIFNEDQCCLEVLLFYWSSNAFVCADQNCSVYPKTTKRRAFRLIKETRKEKGEKEKHQIGNWMACDA